MGDNYGVMFEKLFSTVIRLVSDLLVFDLLAFDLFK